MRYELEALDSLIKIIINPNGNHDDIVGDRIYETTVNSEFERIKLAFTKEVFSLKKDKFIEVYIQHHQEAIIRLLDKLTSSANDRGQKPKISIQLIQQQLEELLSFVEKHFSRYFDLSAKIPEGYRVLTAKDFSEKIPPLTKALKEKGLKNSVIKPLTESFEDFVDNKEVRISFRKLIYLKELYNEIVELSESELDPKDLDRQACVAMIYINYNTPKFLNHCARIIKESYQGKATLSE